MNYQELRTAALAYTDALLVERILGGARLHRIERLLRLGFFIFLSLFVAAFIFGTVPYVVALIPAVSGPAAAFYPGIKAALIFFSGAWLIFLLFDAFYASSYFKDSNPVLPEFALKDPPRIRYEVALAVATQSGDPLFDFLRSQPGLLAMHRLGISAKEILSFHSARGQRLFDIAVKTEKEASVTLGALAEALFVADEALRKFLAERAIDGQDFSGAAEWISRNEEAYKKYRRFWSKDALGRTPGIGKDWAYGETPLLERFAQELSAESSALGAFCSREAAEVERILSRGREANVLLVGEAGVPKLAPLVKLARKIASGSILPPLEHKRIFVFDGTSFVSAMKDKGSFEGQLLRLLSEAVRAGNIIFVFDNFDVLVQGALTFGSNVISLIDDYLGSSNIQIVAISETGAYRQLFEGDTKVRERFERVAIEGAGVTGSMPILCDEALISEREGVFFTFQAVRSIAECADRYFFEGIMPDKGIDLLKEVVANARSKKKSLITRADVLELVSLKTGIATGEAKGEERSKLLRLEEALRERVAGQEDALRAVSGALRRARSGITNPNRPIGSFLFLGPTGVGKTETTKALASVFFGDEKAISRLDMSEYQTSDALHRLIGEFLTGKPGILSSLLRERPFGVLLLDEFEKTNKDVHDLFLQILDEGFFTDAGGKKVNARNLMIIATSNAASDIIWETAQAGKELDKDRIITEVISRGIFKPELINRFDGVVLFRPLTRENLRVIAELMLRKLAKRLEEKGLELAITDALLDYLVSAGQDPKFGARPMNRAIAEKVEQVIADKMLRGDIAAGSRVELTASDFESPPQTTAQMV